MNHKIERMGVRLIIAAAMVICLPSSIEAQVDQQALAIQVQGDDVGAAVNAFRQANLIEPSEMGPELRTAIITFLERLNTPEQDSLRNSEFYLHVVRAVVSFRDPESIQGLVGALGAGYPVVEALSSFGEPAVPGILEVVGNPESQSEDINGGLFALTRMVENPSETPLLPETRAQIRRVAEQRLMVRQFALDLRRAIDLAVALDDEELREIVQALASDPDEVRARGIDDPSRIARVQRHAREALGRRRR